MTTLGIPTRRGPLLRPAIVPSPTLRPTPEQEAIFDLGSGSTDNFMINALAGTGKTSTIEMLQRHVRQKPILYLVFNKKNADEAAKRMLSTTSVKTFNSLGHGIWARYRAKPLVVQPKKTQNILKEIIDETPRHAQSELWASYWQVVDAVARAKALGYVPDNKYPNARRLCTQAELHRSLEERPDDLTSDLIEAVLFRSIQEAYNGHIDFNDQIYMPALFGGTYPKFPLVAVDEYQDLNPTNHALLDRLVTGRLIGVGDPWQNIYGFRGAKAGGMRDAVTNFNMKVMDLSVSFRCPQAIVENARWRVPHFKWMKEGGHVEQLDTLPLDSVPDNCIFLCRNNAPLFSLAFRLLIAGHSVNVAGSDIGPKIVGIMKRLGHQEMSQAQLLSAIDTWEEDKLSRESTTASDMAQCMRVFAQHGKTLSGACTYAEHLFAQSGTIKLMTGHKAKGLEFATVFHLNPDLCKSNEQDLNLRYVIQTRSQDKYFEVNSEKIV